MSERMRDGIVKRGADGPGKRPWSYVVRESIRVPVLDEHGAPVLDADGYPKMKAQTKQRWVSGFRTRAEAKAARDEARHHTNTGAYIAPRDITVGAFLERWVETHGPLKPSTRDSYRANVARYLVPHIGGYLLQELDVERLDRLFAHLLARGGAGGKPLSPRTVQFARAVLRKALNTAVKRGYIYRNPVTLSDAVARPGKPRHTTWTGVQLAAFLQRIAEHRLAPLFHLAAATGVRRGEVLALRWSDVDLDEAVLGVDRSVHVSAAGRSYSTPKNGERRRVSLDPRTVATLRAWRKVQAADRLAWGGAWQDSEGLVFTREDGSPVPPDYVSKVFGALQAGAGLPRLTLHELRHTHATVLLRDGVPVHVVAKRLGHRDPSVTLNVYADVIPDDDGRAVDVFTRAVYGA